MNTNRTKVDFYVEEPCCDCGGELELIDKTVKKGKFLSYGLDTTNYTYKCKECGETYKDYDFIGIGNEIVSNVCFEYKGKQYRQRFRRQ